MATNSASDMKNIAIYCGSSFGKSDVYSEAAEALGKALLSKKIGLVYGGGKAGLMGVVARTVSEGGGQVLGIMPKFFCERQFTDASNEFVMLKEGYGEQRMVDTMHQRKQAFVDEADGFIALPGGYGTLEELIEILTWNQLKLVNKPVGVLNINGYWDHMISWVHKACEEGFIHTRSKQLLIHDTDANSLIEKLIKRADELNSGMII